MAKRKLSALMIVVVSLCAGAAAQVDNCCFVDRQCHSDRDWMDGFYAYQNNQCAATAPSASGAAGQVDNCCNVDRQCRSDQEWIDGYWAYQNNHCPASTASQSGTSTQSESNAVGPIDNCCFAGWQCHNDLDWIGGYHAYQNNQCAGSPGTQHGSADSCCALGWNCSFEFDFIMGRWWYGDNSGQCSQPRQEFVGGVIIEGSEEFIRENRRAMQLIKDRAPEWYAYVTNIIKKIRESWPKPGYGTLHKSFNLPVWNSVDYAAAIIVHETCHVHRSYAGVHTHYLEDIAEEAICDQVAINSLQRISPSTHYSRGRIDDFLRLGHNWNIGPSVQREMDRARHIYSQAA